MVTELYQLLGSAASAAKRTYIVAWEKDLGSELNAAQLTYLYHLTHSRSIDSKIKETNYKILSRLDISLYLRAMLEGLWRPRYTLASRVGMSCDSTLLDKY